MLLYSQYKKDTKNRVNEIAWARWRLLIFIAIVSFVFTAYFFVVWLGWNESEALKMGCMSVVLCIICVMLYLKLYFDVKKIITAAFQNNAKNGTLDFSVELVENNVLKITRMCDRKAIKINKSEIKSIRQLKTINLIVLRGRKLLDLPNREDINELLRSFNGNKITM